jgi:integrase
LSAERLAGEDWLWAVERLRGAYADSTLRTCTENFSLFERWCASQGHGFLPPTGATVALYVEACFRRLGVRAVLSRLYAIRWVCRALDLPDPTYDEAVRLALRRGKRTCGVRPRQAPPLNAALRDRLRAACPSTLLGLRDRALLSLGYDTLCRASELRALRIEDLTGLPDGTARVLVRREKQDVGGAGGVAFLSVQGHADVRAWLEAAGLKAGPILRPTFGASVGAGAMKSRGFSYRIKHMAAAAGVEPALARRLSGHSMRIGAVHDLTIAGCSLLQIMRAGRWRHVDLVAGYAREAPVNVWRQSDGDGYPLAESLHGWRARKLAARGPGSKRRKVEGGGAG